MRLNLYIATVTYGRIIKMRRSIVAATLREATDFARNKWQRASTITVAPDFVLTSRYRSELDDLRRAGLI